MSSGTVLDAELLLLASSSTSAVGQSFRQLSPRGARSKGDQQPNGRVAHNSGASNIFGGGTRILATRVLRARKTRKQVKGASVDQIDALYYRKYPYLPVMEPQEHPPSCNLMLLFISPVVELLAESQSETPLERVLVVMHHIALSCSFISAKGRRKRTSLE